MIALGQKGKQIIEQKFSIERMGQEYVEIYEKTFNNEK
jgi:imidazoleglycerol phosphate dehydratase HisB